ncbi:MULTISPECIES: DUF2848 domain-containing protein [Microbacterium]|uniref:DUF2848 domain-containing protein n=1 Tax=Microbacterium TaxID=33882 RepID=UPI0023DB3435|nr:MULTISPECIES: DUF2848 domain-containing protein [Microbacterium]MDF2044682.1 DUF2848 domain-containing protein [Microbacterium sp. Kw_RZR3]MDF2916795.1 hypothetical protein [Microbacterium sp.]MDQ1075637.1 hypothetical protein [Microbacterium sp. SORGH_AS_0969]MDQ1115878.1 hypothetical protein [Microbacterium testaceum]
MSILEFEIIGEDTLVTVDVQHLYNAGYAGRDQAAVRHHIDELAELGVPAPTTIPSLYPVSSYLARQGDLVEAQHERTSGEAEWGIVIAGPAADDVLLTVACDHTDRALEVHGVAWSKNAGPDVLGRRAWRLSSLGGRADDLRLRAWVGTERTLIQDGRVGELLSPQYWLDVLAERGERQAGVALISGTIPMIAGVDQFTDRWEVELLDETTGESSVVRYDVERMPTPIG